MTTPPIERLRKLHEQDCNCMCTCGECNLPETPCDLIAALDALEAGLVAAEEEIQDLLALRPTRGQLVQRLDAATVLIRQAMEERHYSIRPNTGDSETRCGSPIGTSIDTCENCRPYREWLEGEGQ